MKYCEWCNTLDENLMEYVSEGTAVGYNICEKCNEHVKNGACYKCDGTILGMDIAGLCIDCAQEESEEAQRKVNEVAEGVSFELINDLTSELEFTEDDYDRWVTFSQKNYTGEEIKKHRIGWLKSKLKGLPDWTTERINNNVDAINKIIDKYSSNILNDNFKIIYYPSRPDAEFKGERPRGEIVDRIGDIIIVEV